MFGKEITYEDFNGKQRTETKWFHMSKAEILEWMTPNGDYTMEDVLKRMVEKQNGRDVIESTRDLIYKSYGEKSLDGKRFIKSQEVKDAFMESPAYSELFMELISDAEAAAKFVMGIIPKDMATEIEKMIAAGDERLPEVLTENAAFSVVKSK